MPYSNYHSGMRHRKTRVTVTIDPILVRAATDAVAEGRAESLSGWVNLALTERASKEQHLRAMSAAIAAYEAEHGAITTDEILAQERADRQAARVVRGARPNARKTRRA